MNSLKQLTDAIAAFSRKRQSAEQKIAAKQKAKYARSRNHYKKTGKPHGTTLA